MRIERSKKIYTHTRIHTHTHIQARSELSQCSIRSDNLLFSFPCNSVCANRFVCFILFLSFQFDSYFLLLLHFIFFFILILDFQLLCRNYTVHSLHGSFSLYTFFRAQYHSLIFLALSFPLSLCLSILYCIYNTPCSFTQLSSIIIIIINTPLIYRYYYLFNFFIVFQYSFSCEFNVLTVSHRQVIY